MDHGHYGAGGGVEPVIPMSPVTPHAVLIYRLDPNGNVSRAFGRNGHIAYLESKSDAADFYDRVSYTVTTGIFGKSEDKSIVGSSNVIAELEARLSLPEGALEDRLDRSLDRTPSFGWSADARRATMRIKQGLRIDSDAQDRLYREGWGYLEFA